MGANVVFGAVAAVVTAEYHRQNPQGRSVSLSSHYSSSSAQDDSTGTEGYGATWTNAHDQRRVTNSPERTRRTENNALDIVPEDCSMMDFPTSATAAAAPHRDDPEEEEDEEDLREEAEWELDEELEGHGLYRGSYRRLVLLYSLVPLTFAVTFALLATLPPLLYPLTVPWPYPTAPYLPHPLPELLLSVSLFSLAHALREPLFSFLDFLPISTILATTTHTLLALLLQLVALPILQLQPALVTVSDPSFRSVWWLALGAAAAEAAVALRQGYAARALYRDVLVSVSVHRDGADADPEAGSAHKLEARLVTPGSDSVVELFERREVEDDVYTHGRSRSHSHSQSQPFSEEEAAAAGERQPLLSKTNSKDTVGAAGANGARENGAQSALRMQVEDDLEELLALRAREELEEAYGMPVIRIPVFLLCLQRVNALFLTLGTALLLSNAYLHSTLAPLHFPATVPPTTSSLSNALQNSNPTAPTNLPLALLLPLCWATHTALALAHTPPLLRRIGVPALVYATALVSLGAFFAGVGLWEGLS
ncbi:hypothetical protein H0H81_001860 [Sphagnurus paluster]|uniref:Uncharacterized protein n=1 Tax=Sphagnurus paluster TaxID=117069 RepID=A0A9P7FTY6_9AGAR|nr:hypothetical protein H0H81_001860 [Sphagnurus paluster]